MQTDTNQSAPDKILQLIADYVLSENFASATALETARLCLMDSLGCALLALGYPACTKLLGPIVPGASLHRRCSSPGYRLSTRSRSRGVQFGCDDPLAGL
jgi:2-methylcitrate dehydratase